MVVSVDTVAVFPTMVVSVDTVTVFPTMVVSVATVFVTVPYNGCFCGHCDCVTSPYTVRVRDCPNFLNVGS